MKWLALMALLALAACSQPTAKTRPSNEAVFDGNVLGINGQGSEALMRFSMTVTEPDDSGHPQRFDIFNRCFESGYYDTDKNLFLSGHSPIRKGNNQAIADRGRQLCTSDDVETLQKLLDITYEGFTLAIDEPNARLTTPSGQTVELTRNQMAIFAH